MSDFLWAEDGAIFLNDALKDGYRSLLHPYAGYLHTIPRIASILVTDFLDIRSAPIVFQVIWMVFWIVLIQTVFSIMKKAEWPTFRIAIVLLVLVFLPCGNEVYFNLTNLHWVTGLFLFLRSAFLPFPQQFFMRSLRIVFDFLLSTTSPFSILILLVILVSWIYQYWRSRFLKQREKFNTYSSLFLATLVPLVLGAAVQIYFLSASSATTASKFASITLWVKAIIKFLFFGSQYFLIHVLAIVFWILLVASVWHVHRAGIQTRSELAALLCLLFGILTYLAALAKFRDSPDVLSPWNSGERYFFIPYFCTFMAFFLLNGGSPRKMVFWSFISCSD